MKNLAQKKYEDENGREVAAEAVDCLASYTHIADGFYKWTCGACGCENSDRWYKISGRVVKCQGQIALHVSSAQGCGKLNLLVRTDCADLNKLTWRQYEFEELQREVKRLKDIERFNDDRLLEIKQEILKLVEDAVRSHPSAEKHY